MAHPTIDLVSSPDEDCLSAAYNCVKYCFQANDYQLTPENLATFEIEFDPGAGSYVPPVTFEIAGQLFNAGTQAAYNEIDTLGPYTLLQMAEAFKAAMMTNNYIISNFDLQIVGTNIVATARNAGELENFTFDTSGTISPPIFTFTNGSTATYRNNYRLIVELWECEGENVVKRLSREAFVPAADGSFCINLGDKIGPLLQTTFPHFEYLTTPSAWFNDETISKEVAVNYGESYSDELEECGVDLRTFELTPCIIAVNSAFQREEQEDKLFIMCNDEFMTSMPQYTPLCEGSLVFLWFNLRRVKELVINPATDRIHPYYIVTYTDGTTDERIGTQFSPTAASNDFVAIASDLEMMGFFTDPNKIVSHWEMRVVFQQNSNPATNQYFGSQIFENVPCCEDYVEFYFLNEYGAYDTILFNHVQEVGLEQDFSIVEQYTDCALNNALESGQNVITQTAFDRYTVVSKFANDYQTRLWLRQFMMSPIKYVRGKLLGQDEIFYKAIAITTSATYYNRDDSSLFFRLDFRINENLNIQRN